MTITTTPTRDGKRLVLSFPFDLKLVEAVKTIPSARWDPEARIWSIDQRYADRVPKLSDVSKEAKAEYQLLCRGRYHAFRRAEGGKASVTLDEKTRVAKVRCNGVYMAPTVGALWGAKSFQERGKFAGYMVPVPTAERLDALVNAVANAVHVD